MFVWLFCSAGDTAFSYDATMDTKVKLFRIFENIDAIR